MPGQEEVIVLRADERPAVRSTEIANAALSRYEASGRRAVESVGRVGESVGQTLVSVTHKSQATLDRLVERVEKRAQFAGMDKTERLGAERDILIRRLGGEERQVERVRAAYASLIKSQQDATAQQSRVADAIRDPVGAAREGVEGLLGSYGKVGLVVGAAALGVGAAAKAWWDMASAQSDAAEGMVNLADRTGLTVNQVDRLRAMARIANVNLESLETSARTMAAALDDTGSSGSKAWVAMDRLGVSAYESSGKQRELGQVTLEVIEKLSKVESQTERTALATRLLGRGAQELQPLIKNYVALDKVVRDLGYGNREELIRGLADANDKTDILSLKWDILLGKLSKPIGVVMDVAINPLTAAALLGPFGRPGMSTKDMLGKQDQVEGSASRAAAVSGDAAGQKARGEDFRRRLLGSPERRIDDLRVQMAEAQKKANAGVAGEADKYFGIERQIKLIEATTEREKELQRVRAKGLEYWQQLRGAMANGGLAGSSFEVKPLAIDAVQGLDARTKMIEQRAREEREFADETLRIQNETGERRLQGESQVIERAKQMELAGLQVTAAESMAEKLALEERRYGIVEAALTKEAVLQAESIERQKQRDLEYLDWMQQIYPERAADIAQRRSAVIEAAGQRGAEVEQEWIADTGRARSEMETSQRQIQYDAWQQHFDSLKNGFDGLFDAAIAGGKNFADTLRRTFLSMFLTPVKEAMGNWVAGVFSGGGGGARSGGGGGAWSPVGAMGGMMGGGGMSGVTPPFWGGGGSGAGGSQGYFGGMWGNYKNGLSSLGNIGMRGKDGLPVGMTGSAGSGVGGWQGGALLAGGGVLAMDGLRRGGAVGLAQTTAGAAMIGAKFGGWEGAAIGAVVGAAAGVIRLFMKGAEEKLIQKVRDRFGVTVDKTFAKTLMEQAKAAGGVDVYLGSQQARELIWLYAESTNQRGKVGMVDDRARGVNLQQSGGSMYQSGTYVDGAAYGYSSSLASLGSLRSFTPAAQQVVQVTIQADGESTAAFLEGKTVQFLGSNARVVQAAANSAMAQSAGRIAAAINMSDPLAMTV
jgi:hypothetical protein